MPLFQTSIQISGEMRRALRNLALQRNISFNHLVNNLLAKALADQGVKVWMGYFQPPRKVIPEPELIAAFNSGLTDREIAKQWNIQPRAVSMQLTRLRNKGLIGYRKAHSMAPDSSSPLTPPHSNS